MKGVGLDKRELSVTELYLGRLGLKVWGSMAKLQSVRPSCQSLFREKEQDSGRTTLTKSSSETS